MTKRKYHSTNDHGGQARGGERAEPGATSYAHPVRTWQNTSTTCPPTKIRMATKRKTQATWWPVARALAHGARCYGRVWAHGGPC
eukprot:896926-Alexandrium_andersonii.AAC.1